MKKTITLVSDEEVPITHLLNDKDFEVIKTEKEDVFVMVKK